MERHVEEDKTDERGTLHTIEYGGYVVQDAVLHGVLSHTVSLENLNIVTLTRRRTLTLALPALMGVGSGCIFSGSPGVDADLIIKNSRTHRVMVHVRAVDGGDEVEFSDRISLEQGAEKEYVNPIGKVGGYTLEIDIEGENYTWTTRMEGDSSERDDHNGVIVDIRPEDVDFYHYQ